MYQYTIKPIGDLIPYVNNSRTHDEEQVTQLASSMKEFGFTNPVLIDEQDGLIAGHGRVLAAKRLGLEDIPAIIVDGLTDAQKKALVIADNQLALNADWDIDKLKLEVETLGELDFDLDLLGFDADFLKDLMADPIEEGKTDEDAVPEIVENPVTVEGDIWLLGKHRLMCGDSTSIDALQTLCDGQLVDLLLTDPPYNVAYEGGTGLTIKNDDMADEQFRQFLRDAFVAADSVMKQGASFYIWYADVETYNFTGAVKDAAWKMSQVLIWKKSSLIMGRKDYHFIHEPCIYGWKEGAAHVWASDRKQTTIFEFDKPKKNGDHPTMKPVELFEYQMLNNTKGGDIVLDSFGGSGTTIIAAEKNGRHARVMELDPKYCDVIVKRWQEYTGKKAVNEKTGLEFDE